MQTSVGSGWAQRKISLVDVNMNYAKLIREILDIAIHQSGVNMSFDSDIYQINSMQSAKYPVFNVSPVSPQIEHEQYFEYVLTFYYIDREQFGNNEYSNPETSLIHSNGISILSNIIKKLRTLEGVIAIDDIINYTCWSDTEIFADKCAGVYCEVHIKVAKESNCATY